MPSINILPLQAEPGSGPSLVPSNVAIVHEEVLCLALLRVVETTDAHLPPNKMSCVVSHLWRGGQAPRSGVSDAGRGRAAIVLANAIISDSLYYHRDSMVNRTRASWHDTDEPRGACNITIRIPFQMGPAPAGATTPRRNRPL